MHPTDEEIDRLLAYLPLVTGRGLDACPVRHGSGLFDVHYSPEIEDLLRMLSREPWQHREYRAAGGAAYDSPEAIASADMDRLRAMLTYVVRGERFTAGSFGDAVQAGHIRRLFERLQVLRLSRG